ncbi:MAG: hypothetical protein HOH60_00005 [Opitutae bacterium]|nr:hypothetical protein [Opitutae bacterium]
MKTQFNDITKTSSDSGIDDYFQAFNISKPSGGNFSSNSDFISNYKGSDGQNFISNLRTLNQFTNTDTGSIRGSDEGGTTLNAQAVVPDTAGTPGSSYVEEQDSSSLAATIDGTGLTYDLKSVNSITVNTDTYNIESITNAKSTLNQITTWIENLASERANVGANMSRLEKEIQNLNGKITTGEMAVGRIQDTDVATESTKFASSQVRMQASIAILAQAKDLNVGISDLIRGIMIGQS